MDQLLGRINGGARPGEWTRQGAIAASVAVGVLAILLLIVLHGVNKVMLDDGVVLGLDRDYSVAFFWTAAVFAGAAVVWGRLASVRREHRALWTAMAVLCGLLAVEAVAQLHGRLEDSTSYDLQMLIVQPLVAIAVIALFVACYRRLPRPERYVVAGAVACLVLAQLASMANGQLDLPHAGIVLLSVVEESFEMLTATLLLAAPLGLALGLPAAAGARPAQLEAAEPPAGLDRPAEVFSKVSGG